MRCFECGVKMQNSLEDIDYETCGKCGKEPVYGVCGMGFNEAFRT